MSRPSPRLLPLLLLAGCAATPDAPAPAASIPSVAVAPGSLDGTYQDQRVPDVAGPECGLPAAIGFDVSGATIRLRTHKLRRVLDGTVDSTGRFAMASTDGTWAISGTIVGAQLTAREATPPHHRRHDAGEPVPGGVCTAQISATRVAAPVANGDDESP